MPNGGQFSETQLHALTSLNTALAVFSFLGSSFIIFMFYRVQRLRTFFFKLVVMISASDILYSIGNMMGDPRDGSAACHLQAFLISYFELSSCFWTVCIAFTLYMVLIKGQEVYGNDTWAMWLRYHAFSHGLPVVLSLLPYSTDSIGTSGSFCWVRGGKAGNTWRYLSFYIPLWISIGFNSFAFYKVGNTLANIDRRVAEHSHSDSPHGESGSGEQASSKIRRMRLYPLALVACYLFATINRITQAIRGCDGKDDAEGCANDGMFLLSVLHVIGSSSQGILNSVIYGMTPTVREAFMGEVLPEMRSMLGLGARRSPADDLVEFDTLHEVDSP